MRIILVSVFFSLISLNALAQAPEKMSYQAVVRDNANALVVDKVVGLRISILRGSVTGTAAYVETQNPRSNTNGLVTLEIGAGTVVSGSFAGLNWSTGPYFIQTEIDPSGGSNYSILGVSQLVSVPYALYAKTSGSSTPGPAGPVGATGAVGPQGPIGPSGLIGPPGLQGDKGDTGAIGPQGPQGAQGPQGPKGDKGDRGDAGVAGPQGLIGPAGSTGPAGAPGPMGLTGPAGPPGPAPSSANFVNLTTSQTVEGAKTFTSPIVGSITGNAATATSLTGLTTSVATLNNLSGTNTGDQDLSGLATTTALASKANASDMATALATKVDKVQGKELSTNDYTAAEKTKLASITGINTGDQDLSGYATTTALASKANASDMATALATKVDKVQGKELSTNDYTTAEKTKLASITGINTGDQDLSSYATTTALASKANTSDVISGLATKVDKVQGKDLSANDFTTAEKTKLAAISGINTGDQDLSAFATIAALATKANSSDVTSDLASKVDKVQGKGLSTNDYTTVEKDKLAAISGTNTGDQTNITGNAATATLAQTVTTNANLTGPITSLGNVTSIAAQTGTGTTFVMSNSPTLVTPALGTPASGIATNLTGLPLDTGVTGVLSVGNGGTGTNSLTGILKGNGTGAFTAAVPGSDYQTPLSGTVNFLPKFTGSAAIGNSQIFDNASSVGIGVTTPNASAKLEISSTTQGFLPPRMTYVQRTAIASPAQGLVIYCTTCGNSGELQVYNGSSWTNLIGNNTQIGIGQLAFGGRVAYIFQPGDPGYIAGEIHGIIASNDEWTARWGCNGRTLSGAGGTGLGTGAQNTNEILNDCSEAGIAAKICADYTVTESGVVYSDWHLPSITELQRILANRQSIGGFNSPYILYWSSSQAGDIFAYVARTNNPGTDYVTNKSGGDYGSGLRAVRYF